MFLPVTALATSDPYTVYNSIQSSLEILEGGTITGNPFYVYYSAFASRFTLTASGTLTSIDLSLYNFGYYWPAAHVDLSLTSLGPSGLPSQTALTSGMITVTNRGPQLSTFLPTNQVFLQAGTPYWLVLAQHNSTSSAGWTFSLQFSGYVAWTETPNPSSGESPGAGPG